LPPHRDRATYTSSSAQQIETPSDRNLQLEDGRRLCAIDEITDVFRATLASPEAFLALYQA
jgi:hypothetical protein